MTVNCFNSLNNSIFFLISGFFYFLSNNSNCPSCLLFTLKQNSSWNKQNTKKKLFTGIFTEDYEQILSFFLSFFLSIWWFRVVVCLAAIGLSTFDSTPLTSQESSSRFPSGSRIEHHSIQFNHRFRSCLSINLKSLNFNIL